MLFLMQADVSFWDRLLDQVSAAFVAVILVVVFLKYLTDDRKYRMSRDEFFINAVKEQNATFTRCMKESAEACHQVQREAHQVIRESNRVMDRIMDRNVPPK